MNLCYNILQVEPKITGSLVYISLLPTYTSLFSSRIKHTANIPNHLDIMWLAQNSTTCSITHLMTCTTLYNPSGLRSRTHSCIITQMLRMEINFHLTAMVQTGSCKGDGKQLLRQNCRYWLSIDICHWIGTVYGDTSRKISVETYGYLSFLPSKIRGHGTFFLVWSFLIQSRIAPCHNSCRFGCTPEQMCTSLAVVGSHLLMYGANDWHNTQPNEQLEVAQPPCLWGSSWLRQSAENQLGDGFMCRHAFLFVWQRWFQGNGWAAMRRVVQARRLPGC